jgi:hypothetical protein
MQQIDAADEKVGDPDDHEIGIIDDLAGIPGQDKYAASDDNAEDLRQAVEKEVAVKIGQVEAKKD